MAEVTLSSRHGLNTTAPLNRFNQALQPQLARFAARSPRIAQLAQTHPYLFVALACQTGPQEFRRIAIQRTVDGEPLSRVCDAVQMPLSLRRLPPESCIETPSPALWARAADKTLAANIPAKPALARQWLRTITLAHHLCDERFALWVARQPEVLDTDKVPEVGLVALAVYAWHVQHGELPPTVTAALRWTPRLSLKTAIRRARHWRAYCALERLLTVAGVAPWIEHSVCNGYEFMPLNTAERLFEEGVAMKNCVMSYGEAIAKDDCRLFGIRRSGAYAATLEIRHIKPRNYLAITQIKGWANGKCPDDAAIAARDWIADFRDSPPVPREPPANRPDQLAGYRRAKLAGPFGCASLDWSLIEAGLSSLSWRDMMR